MKVNDRHMSTTEEYLHNRFWKYNDLFEQYSDADTALTNVLVGFGRYTKSLMRVTIQRLMKEINKNSSILLTLFL